MTHLHFAVRLPHFQLNLSDEKLRLIPVPIIGALYSLMIQGNYEYSKKELLSKIEKAALYVYI